jgi:hypothetical protein
VLPANIDVTTVAAGQRPLDGYLTGRGGTDGASLLAVPIRRPEVIAAKEAANDAAPDGWAALTGTCGTALAAATGLSAAEAISAYGYTFSLRDGATVPDPAPEPRTVLDIAGAARAGSNDGEFTKGGTGFGTRLLLRWLTQAGEPQA